METLIGLSELSYWSRLIGFDEYCERLNVAHWLDDKGDGGDPRLPECDVSDEGSDAENMVEAKYNDSDSSNWIEFLVDSKWYFTKADPDTYPSVPHGHLISPTNSWPKLNPYTGRAFKQKHQEDTSLRLSKAKMNLLWNDSKFRNFCLEHIKWHRKNFKYYTFPVQDHFRLPRRR